MFQLNSREPWALFLVIAIAVHLATFAFLTAADKFFSKPQKMPVIYTVKLFESTHQQLNNPKPKLIPKAKNTAETKPVSKSQPKSKPIPAESKPTVKKIESAKKVVVPHKKPKPSKQVEKKVVSVAPKKVVKKKEKTKLVKKIEKKEKVKKKKQLAPQKAKKADDTKLLEKKIEQRIAELKKRVKEKQEEEYLQKRLAALANKRSGSGAGLASGDSDGANVDEWLRRYFAKVWSKIRENWKFPDALMQNKKPMCIIVVRISKDGSLEKAWFEKRSQIAAFNIFAMKAVRDAAPFEPIPRQLHRSYLEIGVRFKPGSVGE